jgi:amylosucrase
MPVSADFVAALRRAARTRAVSALGPVEGAGLLARLDLRLADVVAPLEMLYAARTDLESLVDRLVGVAVDSGCRRTEPLRALDRAREVDPAWFQDSRMSGYVCYADRFAGDLRGVTERLDYLDELGITYLHLMPLLASREGDDDGGYAVVDYASVDPRLGTMADLESLAAALHERQMSLCVDLVVNHTAAEHPWARAAAAGDATYRDFFRIFPDRELPDRYERTLPEVFPDQAPGSFTYVEDVGWVWTTFNSFQWDLDWSNPEVFAAMLGIVLDLAGRGVDVLRLDAAPFLWKREGTDCQNQPEVHQILRALRALLGIAAPGVLAKAEAIVAPQQLVQYLGAHDRFQPECDLAYNNQLMVMLWSALASRDVGLARQSLAAMRPAPQSTSWVTYLRCHDDIGWAVSDEDAWAVGLDPAAHRRFLSDFFSGAHPGSFARGAVFQHNPRTGDSRTSGTAAALCGLDTARGARGTDHAEQVDVAIRRLVTLYSVVYSWGGIPLLYMGDEIGLPNDGDFGADPAHAGDNRWLHRPPMDWTAAARRHDPTSVEGRVFAGVAGLSRTRAGLMALCAGTQPALVDAGSRHVLAYRRRHPRSGPLLAVAAFSDDPVQLDRGVLTGAGGLPADVRLAAATPGTELTAYALELPAWGHAWLTADLTTLRP